MNTEEEKINNESSIETVKDSENKESFLKRSGSFHKQEDKKREPGGFEKKKFSSRQKSEFDQKIIDIRRVTRVVAGGRRFSFSVALIAGDRKGSVGIGIGKASDTALAITKAFRSAKKNMIKVETTKKMSIPHDIKAKFGSAKVLLMPNKGKGLVAGSSVRDILNLGGIKDVSSKILSGSKNKFNIARATIKALSMFSKSKKAIIIEDKNSKTDQKNQVNNSL